MRCIAFSLVALVMFVLSAGAAENDAGCDMFAWSLARERAWFANTDKVSISAGDKLAFVPTRAMSIKLLPGNNILFALPPERKPRSERWFGGAIWFAAVSKPGIYQVTLSEDAWVDVIQNNRYARSVGSSGRRDCAGLRKSIRLELEMAPFVLQISGVESDKVLVAISSGE
jgi:hypothetical protein